MHHAPCLARVRIDLAAIRANYRLLARQTPQHSEQPCPSESGPSLLLPARWPALMPVVKADAYGHGHIQVASALREEGATWFASGAVQEAALLREGLDRDAAGKSKETGIVSLLGLVGPEDVGLCLARGIVPLLHCPEQLHLLEGAKDLLAAKGALPVAIKCNTGMSRLGFNEDELSLLRERLRQLPVRPVLALSHLHSADSADGRAQVRTQAGVFARVLAALRQDWPHLAASLGNSAGTLLAEEITALIGPHLCRPGLILYGCNPFYGTALEYLGRAFTPAMSVYAPLLATRRLAAGEGIGYGHIFTAKQAMPVGIVGAGYADCYPRFFSNRGLFCIEGVRVPVIGRVAMQMTAVDLSALGPEGGKGRGQSGPRTAWMLGGPYPEALRPEEVAALWGSIPYEVLCLLGRNEREYPSAREPLPKSELVVI